MGKPQKQQRFTELDYDGQKQEMHLISVIINYMVSLSFFFFLNLLVNHLNISPLRVQLSTFHYGQLMNIQISNLMNKALQFPW